MTIKETREAILQNLKTVAGRNGTLTRQQYRESNKAKFASSTVEKYFGGSFTKAVSRSSK